MGHKRGETDSVREQISMNKDHVAKKLSILSEIVKEGVKDCYRNRNPGSHRSLLDERSTVRDKIKKFHRQNSFDDLKRMNSPFIGSNR